MSTASKKQAVLDRIQHLEEAIAKAREFLENGAHAEWHGFRPLFTNKVIGGKILPPHKDWVRNVFLPRREGALRYLEKVLDQLERSSAEKSMSRGRRLNRAEPSG